MNRRPEFIPFDDTRSIAVVKASFGPIVAVLFDDDQPHITGNLPYHTGKHRRDVLEMLARSEHAEAFRFSVSNDNGQIECRVNLKDPDPDSIDEGVDELVRTVDLLFPVIESTLELALFTDKVTDPISPFPEDVDLPFL